MHYLWLYIFRILYFCFALSYCFNHPLTDYDIDHSNNIDTKEALFLGLALSIDSACVGIGSGIIGFNDIILPFFVASFQLVFLNCGNLVANNIAKYINISERALAIFSSIILILVGVFRAI